MESNEIVKKINDLIKEQIKTSFVESSRADTTAEQGMGLILSHTFDYDGASILKAAAYALEDANFHKECEVILELINKIEPDWEF